MNKPSRNSIGGGRRLSSARKNRLKRGKERSNSKTGPGHPYRPAAVVGGTGANRSDSRAAARRSTACTPAPLRRSKTEDISDNGDDKEQHTILQHIINEIVAESIYTQPLNVFF